MSKNTKFFLHNGGSEPPIPIRDVSAPVPEGKLKLRLLSFDDDIPTFFQDDKELTLLIKTLDRDGFLISIDLEAGKDSRPQRYISFPGKHDSFSDDSGSWVLLDHDQLAFRSKGFAQRIFTANDDGVMEEISEADREKEAKRQSVQRGSAARGGLNDLEQGALKYRGSENKVLNQKKVDNRDRLPWIIAGGLLVGILLLLFKMLKGKLHSC